MSYQPCSQYKKTDTFTCVTKENKNVSCFMYFDHQTNMIQRRCLCEPNYHILNATQAVNGCGPESMIGKSKEKNIMSQLLDKNTTKCCSQHDVCMGNVVDSGKCSVQFSQCLAKVPDLSPTGVFTRNLLDYFVKTSSNQFLHDPSKYACKPIALPRLNTLQRKSQQERWELLHPQDRRPPNRWWW